MTFGVDFRIKEAKERAAFPELYPDHEPPLAHVSAKWNLEDTLAAIDRADAVQRRGYVAMGDALILAVLCGRTPEEARAAAKAQYERTINEQS